MTAIWLNDNAAWRLVAPAGFPDEAALHSLVEQAPQILPLAGSPALVVIGREVQIGSGYADLIAIEPSGRLVVIEVKLARNAEARRAVVAQVLTYAAFLKGVDPTELERSILGRHLSQRGYKSLAEAVAANDQEGSYDADKFAAQLATSLEDGRFRLVFVLDEAPTELVRLVGYLESISDKLLIDLVTVSSFQVNGSQILIPQRVDPERPETPTRPLASPTPASSGDLVEGAERFLAAIETAPERFQPQLQRLADWALALERHGYVRLQTYQGSIHRTLLPRLLTENVGLVTTYHGDTRGPSLSLFRSVFERRAPQSIGRVEALIQPARVGNGNTLYDVTDKLLDVLTSAYQEAATGKISALPSDATAEPGA